MASDEYGTPQALFDVLDLEFDFEWDAAASAVNHKCPHYWTQENSALDRPGGWEPLRYFCNPPYSKPNIPSFIEAAIEASQNGALVVMLLPCDTGTVWYQDLVETYAMEVRKLRGRIRFEGATQGAKFATLAVIFAPHVTAGVGPREWCWDWKAEV